LSVTGTPREIYEIVKEMGEHLQDIPEYDEVKDTDNYKQL